MAFNTIFLVGVIISLVSSGIHVYYETKSVENGNASKQIVEPRVSIQRSRHSSVTFYEKVN